MALIIRMCLLTNVITMHNYDSNAIPRDSINEYTYENGVQFEIKSL